MRERERGRERVGDVDADATRESGFWYKEFNRGLPPAGGDAYLNARNVYARTR